MSSRIKGLFSSKKKKDERNGLSSSRLHSKEIFAGTGSNHTSTSSLALSKQRPDSVASQASFNSALDMFHQRERQTPTPSSTAPTLGSLSTQQQQSATSTVSKGSFASFATTGDIATMTSDSKVQDLDITVQPIKPGNLGTLPPSPPLSQQHLPEPDIERKQEPAPGQSQPAPRTPPTTGDMIDHGNDSVTEKRSIAMDMTQTQQLSVPGATNGITNGITNGNGNSNGNGNVTANGNRSFNQGNLSFSTRDPFGNSSLRYDKDESRISQKRDGSFGEQRSYVQDNQLNEDGIYLNSTTEFFPVEDQDEQVYLEQYSEEGDEFPVLIHKVSKLQKQVREMRKFMRGLVQLQVEQYEPATIMIQAWWRGCLVRRELKKQKVFSWHRNPSRNVKKFKYLTRTDLHQSCERISAPKPSILVTADLGAEKEMIAVVKLQAVFRSQLVQRRVRAHKEGNRAAMVIQSRWRGYRTRTLDTRLGVEQLRFRNLKIQKAFGRVSIKLQYLQGRILGLEENSLPLHEAQELIHKEIEDMADQIDGLKQDLEHGLKQLDEQMSEEREQSTIEMKALTDRIQKLEDELGSIRNSNSKIERRVKSLSLEVPGALLETDVSEQDDDDDDEYEVQYDEDGNRIEKAPSQRTKRRESLLDQQRRQEAEAGSRRSSQVHPIIDSTVSGSPTPLVESPTSMQQQQHRRSVGSVHSQGAPRPRSISSHSQPSPSPGQTFPRSFPASFSPTFSNAQTMPENGAFPAGVRPHSIPYPGASNISNNPPRPLTMDPNQLFRFHPSANQYIPVSPSSASAGVTSYPGLPTPDPKKYVSMDDFEYMQAEVDTLRINNDRLEGMVHELTMRLNAMAAKLG